ncbi:MAG: hypothetical protein IBX52_04475 [Bacterioplanes sp.]|nr:hypothetical protein [Bacterioplanes sp.]
MPHINIEHIAQAVRVVDSMSLAEKEKLADELYQSQPNIFASVLIQNKLGTSYEDLDHLLNILFKCFVAVRIAGLEIPTISEEVQEICLARIVGKAQFIEGLSTEMADTATQDQVKNHKERNLLALVISELTGHKAHQVQSDADKLFILTALNIVETVAYFTNDIKH